MEQDSEFLLLNTIHTLTRQKADISQRDLSRAIHLSLGMTNALLKRLSQKGFILIHKMSPRNVSYALTPDGMNELSSRTNRYLRRTIKQVVNYKETIESIARDAATRGFRRIGLLGNSDLDFIIEHASRKAGLPFDIYPSESAIPGDTFVFVSEKHAGPCPLSGTALASVYDLCAGSGPDLPVGACPGEGTL